jgi:hypothetical protein
LKISGCCVGEQAPIKNQGSIVRECSVIIKKSSLQEIVGTYMFSVESLSSILNYAFLGHRRHISAEEPNPTTSSKQNCKHMQLILKKSGNVKIK